MANLLYIHTDQHAAHVLGCAGDPLVQTPNLDRLASEGARFDACYCASPICVPSRMAMLSGRHPHQNEVWGNSHRLDSAIPTLAHSMGAAGYNPVLVGRMHSIGPDQTHGYAQRYVGDHSVNHPGNPGNPDRGILHGTSGPDRESLVKSGAGQSAYQVHDEEVVASTVDYFNRLGVQKRAYGEVAPFSLSVGLMLPHPPYVAREEDFAPYADSIALPRKPKNFEDVQHPYLREWWRYTGLADGVSDEMTQRSRAAYWGLVQRVDVMIGQILDALHGNDLADDTLIVYTSDHGDMVGEQGLWWKHVFYEESARVPLILHWPGVIAPGQTRAEVVSALDVTATLLDALDAPPLPGSPGRSLLGLVAEARPTPQWKNVAFSEYCADEYVPESVDQGRTYQRMIRQDEWKLIYYHGFAPQLFNLREDPDELLDRADDPACRSIREELVARVLDGWNPDAIAEKMAALRADNEILRQWAQHVHPVETHRWSMAPEMNYLAGADSEKASGCG